MYDPDGADTGREWVEVYNEASTSVDLASVAIVEGTTRHKISSYASSSTVLPAGAYAVVADRPDLFSADYPGVAQLLDSAFSLANDGETLKLSGVAGAPDLDVVSWPASAGASGGKSWQRSAGAWVAALATPGQPNATGEQVSVAAAASSSTSLSAHAETVGVTTYQVPPAFSVSVGRPRLAAPRVPVRIEPAASADGPAAFRWSWGDGASSRGKAGLHSYRYPGTYAVVLYAVRGLAAAVARTTVTVVRPDVALSGEPGPDGYVELQNRGAGEVNLGGFEVAAGRRYELPEDSLLLPGSSVRVSSETLGFPVATGSLALRYPDGTTLAVGTSSARTP